MNDLTNDLDQAKIPSRCTLVAVTLIIGPSAVSLLTLQTTIPFRFAALSLAGRIFFSINVPISLPIWNVLLSKAQPKNALITPHPKSGKFFSLLCTTRTHPIHALSILCLFWAALMSACCQQVNFSYASWPVHNNFKFSWKTGENGPYQLFLLLYGPPKVPCCCRSFGKVRPLR
jgi:hypothetical protein